MSFDGISDEIIAELSTLIEGGHIHVIADHRPWFDGVSDMYPFDRNRIDWRRTADMVTCDVVPVDAVMADEELQVLLEEHCDLVALWFQNRGISQRQRVVWLGDGSDLVLGMELCTFMKCFAFLLSWPQHCYVVPLNRTWCLNYTMEGQLFFGRPKREERP